MVVSYLNNTHYLEMTPAGGSSAAAVMDRRPDVGRGAACIARAATQARARSGLLLCSLRRVSLVLWWLVRLFLDASKTSQCRGSSLASPGCVSLLPIQTTYATGRMSRDVAVPHRAPARAGPPSAAAACSAAAAGWAAEGPPGSFAPSGEPLCRAGPSRVTPEQGSGGLHFFSECICRIMFVALASFLNIRDLTALVPTLWPLRPPETARFIRPCEDRSSVGSLQTGSVSAGVLKPEPRKPRYRPLLTRRCRHLPGTGVPKIRRGETDRGRSSATGRPAAGGCASSCTVPSRAGVGVASAWSRLQASRPEEILELWPL